MSIVDSSEDLAAAKTRIAAVDERTLLDDLRFWSIASQDARVEHIDLSARQADCIRRYQEADQWTQLIGAELRDRRDKRIGQTPVAQD